MLPLQFGLGHTELQSTTKSQRLDCLREGKKKKKKKGDHSAILGCPSEADKARV